MSGGAYKGELRIFLAEDNPFHAQGIADAICKACKPHAINVTFTYARTEHDALQVLQSGRDFDLCVVDCMIPWNKDLSVPDSDSFDLRIGKQGALVAGLRLIEGIRYPENSDPRFPVVVHTVANNNTIGQKALAHHADYIVKKPLGSDPYSNLVTWVLERAKQDYQPGPLNYIPYADRAIEDAAVPPARDRPVLPRSHTATLAAG